MTTKFRYIHIAGAAILLTGLLTSCKKSFLETQPKGKLIVQATSDYDLMLDNGSLLTNSTDVGVPMGDEVAAVDNYFSNAVARNQRLFRWDSVIYDPGIYANEMNSLMTSLYIYNKIINEVMSSTGGTDQQKKEIMAEAKANRAYNNFWLINMYGKPYNSATAANDPGYPIVTTADVTQTSFTRASVQAMYDFILQDLTSAIPDLNVAITSRERMGKAAAEMLLGKVYVFMGRYTDAKTQLDAAVTDLAATGSGTTLTNMALYDLNVTLVPGGTWNYSTATATTYFNTEPVLYLYTENIHCRTFSNGWSFTSSECVLTPQTVQLYTSSDKRLNYFTSKPYLVSGGYPVAGVLRRNSPYATPNGETIGELYLLRAECEARNNDLADAKTDLQTLRIKRMSAADAVVPDTLTQMQMIQFVLNERIREFALQGYRWWDMRRLSVDPLFAGTVYTHTQYDATGNVSATYTLKPERLTLRFPQVVMDLNPGMQNNP